MTLLAAVAGCVGSLILVLLAALVLLGGGDPDPDGEVDFLSEADE